MECVNPGPSPLGAFTSDAYSIKKVSRTLSLRDYNPARYSKNFNDLLQIIKTLIHTTDILAKKNVLTHVQCPFF